MKFTPLIPLFHFLRTEKIKISLIKKKPIKKLIEKKRKIFFELRIAFRYMGSFENFL